MRRTTASSLGKMPTTSVRRLISPLTRPVLCRERHIGEHVRFCLVQKGGELGQLGSQLVGDLAPLSSGALSVVLGEGGGSEGGDDAAPLTARMREHIAHEMDAAALPGCVVHLGDGAFDALMSVRDNELEAAGFIRRNRNRVRPLLPQRHRNS
jgi:hypothetical protein